MRHLIGFVVLLILVACAPPVPNSGVGFDNYDNQRAARDAQLSGSAPLVSGSEISQESVPAGTSVPLSATKPPSKNSAGISDEQNFDAVASRESIESDRDRLAAQRDAYEVIAPTALPTRSGKSGPSIVDFALSTTNQVGQPIYSRSVFAGQSRFERNCAKYPSSDIAQAEFLKSGGPKRDGKGLDPDGDGFACYWDPSPFRRAVQN